VRLGNFIGKAEFGKERGSKRPNLSARIERILGIFSPKFHLIYWNLPP